MLYHLSRLKSSLVKSAYLDRIFYIGTAPLQEYSLLYRGVVVKREKIEPRVSLPSRTRTLIHFFVAPAHNHLLLRPNQGSTMLK